MIPAALGEELTKKSFEFLMSFEEQSKKVDDCSKTNPKTYGCFLETPLNFMKSNFQ